MTSRISRAAASDLLARLCVAVLFVLLAITLWKDFLKTGHVTGLLLVASESLVAILTIFRRRAQLVDRSPVSTIVTVVSLIAPPLLRPTSAGAFAPDQVTATISAFGLAIVIYGKLVLGRSFGLVPANRGVVTAGPYATVRHPIYAGYLMTHAAFVAQYPSIANIVIILIGDAALIWRALREERVLAGDGAYRDYCTRVAWHLVPGVF